MVSDEVVYGTWDEIVAGCPDGAVRALLADDGDIEASVVDAGQRATVIGALPSGVRLRGSQFTGAAPTPADLRYPGTSQRHTAGFSEHKCLQL